LKVSQTDLFKKWLNNIKDNKLKLIIEQKIVRIEEDGYLGKTYPIVGVKGISEIKIERGAGYRVYFNLYIKDDEVWLLSGGDKSTQTKDIEVAKRLLQEISEEKEAKK
jgi:putative addiction module killer protein